MAESDRLRWEAKYADKDAPAELDPDSWLRQSLANVSPGIPGTALDLACGLGDNAIWLAEQGWRVEAVDIAPTALRIAANQAEKLGVDVTWREADLDDFVPEPGKYDLVVVFRFLDRTRLPKVIDRALRPGGLLLYETFTASQLKRKDNHLKNASFVLMSGELPNLFPNFEVLEHQEIELPDRSVARYCGRKRRS